MVVIHKELDPNRWSKLSLCEQMGNIGSEVKRTLQWKDIDDELFKGSMFRALELFDLTMADMRWRERLYEIARAREVFLDVLSSRKNYRGSVEGLEKYFYYFAFCALAGTTI